METNEGPPMEERDFPEGSSFTREEDEEENRDFLEFLDESKYGLNKKRDYLDFVDNIRELRNNEYLQERSDSDKYTYLPNTQSIRFKTIEVLKEMREESYTNLKNYYPKNDTERKKIDDNRDKYVEHKSENKDVRIFIDFSKTISELENEIYSENSMQAMYIFADYEEEPKVKKFREKLIEFFKDRRNTYLFFAGGTVIIALSSIVVTIEEILKKLKNEVEKKMYKKYLEVKDEIKNEVGKTRNEVKDSIRDEVGKTKGEIKDEVEKTKDEIRNSLKDEIEKTKDEIKDSIKDEIKNRANKLKKNVSISQKKVEYTLLSLLNDILYKVLEYIFVVLIFCVVAYFLYYKYGRKTR